jgi:osmotically-inducible protein OsmY
MKNQINGLRWLACGLALATATAVTGCAGNQNERSTGQYIDDKSLTLRVHDALADNAEYKFHDVNVAVNRGTVQLSGWVDTSAQKSKADEIAKGVQGVNNVEDNITVKPGQ